MEDVSEAEQLPSKETLESLPTGIKFRKDTELRDRMVRIMARREAENPNLEDEETARLQRLYDGAVVYFAWAAKALWPGLDVQPIERALLNETNDERETYAGRARQLIGNAVIRYSEDLTYWLNKETLAELDGKQ